MNTEDLSTIECPVILTIKLIGNKWKLLILRALFLGPISPIQLYSIKVSRQ